MNNIQNIFERVCVYLIHIGEHRLVTSKCFFFQLIVKYEKVLS